MRTVVVEGQHTLTEMVFVVQVFLDNGALAGTRTVRLPAQTQEIRVAEALRAARLEIIASHPHGQLPGVYVSKAMAEFARLEQPGNADRPAESR